MRLFIIVNKIYEVLLKILGPQGWWPVDFEYHRKNGTDYRFEIVIGAILVQRTKWEIVEKVLERIKKRIKLDPKEFLERKDELLKIIRNRRKFESIINFCNLLKKYNFSFEKLFSKEKNELKNELMKIKGIGEETAEVICLYAGEKKFFIVDKYLKEVFNCLGIKADFRKLKEEIEKKDFPIEFYKEFHALIDVFAKKYCKKKRCCPLSGLLPHPVSCFSTGPGKRP